MKKAIRIVLLSIGVLLVLILLLLGALFFAIQHDSFQNYLKDKALPYIENALTTRVELERISIRFRGVAPSLRFLSLEPKSFAPHSFLLLTPL